MKPREKKSKISNCALTVFFYLLTLGGIGLTVWYATMEMSLALPIIITLFALLMGIFWTFVCREIFKRYEGMHKLAPVVESNYKRVQEELVKIGFHASATYSSLGYDFAEMRDDFCAPDNVNIELDDDNRSIVVYVLSPFSFKKYSYSDILSCDVKDLCNDSGAVKNVQVHIKFYDRYNFIIPVSDLQTHITDVTTSAKYDEMHNEANTLVNTIIRAKMKI